MSTDKHSSAAPALGVAVGSAFDAALIKAADIARFHAQCHEERGKTYSKPGDKCYTICKYEAEVCREVANAIDAYRRSLSPNDADQPRPTNGESK